MKAAWLTVSLSLVVAPVRADGLKDRAVLPYTETVRCLAFSPDGQAVATGSGKRDRATGRTVGEVRVWDVATAKERQVLHGHTSDVQALAFGPDGKTLATGANDGTVKVWDLEAGEERQSFRNPESGLHSLAFGPDGKTLAFAGYQAARLVDVASGREVSAFKRPGPFEPPAFSPDLKTLACANHQDVDLYDTATGTERRVLEDHRGGVYRMGFSADGRTLAAASYRSESPRFFGEVAVWDPATGKRRAVFKDRINFVRSVALNPDGTLLAVAGSKELTGPNDLKLIDVATGRDLAVRTLPKGELAWALAFRPDGRVLAAVTGKTLTLWDVAAGPAGPT